MLTNRQLFITKNYEILTRELIQAQVIAILYDKIGFSWKVKKRTNY